jgi:hypothetical protein
MMGAVYGQFLWWLRDGGRLDPRSEPADQMTPELVAQFIAERRRTVSDNTTFNNLRLLSMMMKSLDPRHDWRWICKHGEAPRRWEALAARREPRQFPVGLLMHRLLAALQDALVVPLDQLPLTRVRDCVLVAFAINANLRLRNYVAMRLEHNLVCRKAGWEVIFEETEVKNRTAIILSSSSRVEPVRHKVRGYRQAEAAHPVQGQH